MVSKILDNPEFLGSKLFDFTVNDTDSTGGVALDSISGIGGDLLDDDGNKAKVTMNPLESEVGGSVMEPLQPDLKPRPANAPRLGERWPTLPTHKRNTSTATDLGSSLGGISISGSSGGAHLPTSGPPSARIPSPPSSASTSKPPQNGSATASTRTGSNAWVESSTASEVLFKGAQKTPITNEWEAALRAKDQEYERANSSNMLMQRYWDPTHKDYDPERFYNPVIEMYVCPLPQCEESYPEPFMLEYHINNIHGISQRRCPHCLKLFKSVTALVAHCEAPTSHCGISRSNRYGEAIDQFSGGFLGAKDARRPDITDEERKDRMGDDAKVVSGSGYKINMIKYESTLPIDWPADGFREHTKVGREWDEGGRGPNRHGNMNPAVPLSKSRKQHHSTMNIYPEPFKDFTPELNPKMFAPSREERSERQAQQGTTNPPSENVFTSTPTQSRKKKNQRRENVTSQLVDSDKFKAVRKGAYEQEIPEEPMVPMRREDAIYLSRQQSESDAASVSASSTAGSSVRRSAWQ